MTKSSTLDGVNERTTVIDADTYPLLAEHLAVIGGDDELSSKFQDTAVGWVFFDDLDTLACRATLEGHAHRVYDVALSPDGTTALTASHDRTIRVWDVATGATRATLHGHSDAVFAVAFVPGERSAVSASKDGTIRVWGP